ncbi:MAG: riboflavin synthase [Polyangiaceae bacterium]
MFTGLIEEVGSIVAKKASGGEARLRIRCVFGVGNAAPGGSLVMGESIAIDGACLTVVAIHADGFEIDASAETLARTTLGALAVGSRVNLERAMPLGARMGGHLVTGHVDGTGALVSRTASGESTVLMFSFPPALARFIAEKGSICVCGISLTVNAVSLANTLSVTIIPHTQKMTTLGELAVGGAVNLEIDLVARYVLRARDVETASGSADSRALEGALERAGYIGGT